MLYLLVGHLHGFGCLAMALPQAFVVLHVYIMVLVDPPLFDGGQVRNF